MAELPGWDRDRLATARPADVEAARWRVFVSAVVPLATRDLDGELEHLKLEELSPRERERREKLDRPKRREELIQALKRQRELRRMLLLDPDG